MDISSSIDCPRQKQQQQQQQQQEEDIPIPESLLLLAPVVPLFWMLWSNVLPPSVFTGLAAVGLTTVLYTNTLPLNVPQLKDRIGSALELLKKGGTIDGWYIAMLVLLISALANRFRVLLYILTFVVAAHFLHYTPQDQCAMQIRELEISNRTLFVEATSQRILVRSLEDRITSLEHTVQQLQQQTRPLLPPRPRPGSRPMPPHPPTGAILPLWKLYIKEAVKSCLTKRQIGTIRRLRQLLR